MVGDFMVCVDRLIASAACFDSSSSAISSDEFTTKGVVVEEESSENSSSLKFVKLNGDGLENKVSECRICQEEGDEAEMEAPCACNGTLKFAHRKCIQRWCNKKGDITCEICNQEYAPNYSVPLTRANSDVITIDIRQGWGGRLDLNDAQLIAIQQEILNSEYEDYAAAHNSGIACCRSVALILMLLLLLRHVLVVLRDAEMLVDASDFFNLTFQFAGFLLPCYLIVRSCYILQTRRRRQV